MPNLMPYGYEDEVITEADLMDGRPIGYRNGVAFDYIAGDFMRDGRHRIIASDGIESWKSWCINCIQTERYKYLAYSSDFGVEWEKVFAATSREEAESILIRQATEAILADPYGRAAYIDNISCTWPKADAVLVEATVHGIDDVTIDITAYITKGAA